MEIQVTSMRMRSNVQSGRGSVLANFDVRIGGLMTVEGCTLSQWDDGTMAVYGPAFTVRGRQIRVSFNDRDLRGRIAEAASRAYREQLAHHVSKVGSPELTDHRHEDQSGSVSK